VASIDGGILNSGEVLRVIVGEGERKRENGMAEMNKGSTEVLLVVL
jgi:hypothetical protein